MLILFTIFTLLPTLNLTPFATTTILPLPLSNLTVSSCALAEPAEVPATLATCNRLSGTMSPVILWAMLVLERQVRARICT